MISARYQDQDARGITSSPQEGALTFQNNYSHDIQSTQQQHTRPPLNPVTVYGPTPSDPGLADRHAFKTFAFRRKALRTDMQIVDVGSQFETPTYFAEVREWKFNTPDVTLHAGTDSTGEIIGVAHFRHSLHIMLGLGNPLNDVSGVVWEKMNRETFFKNKWTFEFTDSSSCNRDVPNAPIRRHFIWQRTNKATDGVKGIAKMSIRNVRLVDQDSGEVVAVFLADNLTSLKKKGELRIFQKFSTDLERIIILGCASISEKMTRD